MTKSHDSHEHHNDAHVRPEPINSDSFETNTFFKTVTGLTKVLDGPATFFRGDLSSIFCLLL